MYTAASAYGATTQMPSYGVAADTQAMGTDDIETGIRGLVDPTNPLVWFGVFLLITVGAAGVAGSVRLGRAKVSAELGQS